MFATLLPLLGLLAGIIPILAACVIFALLVGDIFKVLPLVFEVAFQILDPFAFVKDLLFGIIIGIEKLLTGVIDIMFGKMQESGEKFPGGKQGLFQDGIFSTKKRDPKTGKIVESNNTKCIPPSTLRLIMMVLCPPFSIFMKYGILRGWLWIILCTILTYYFYYFPGLIFASLHTLCF